jgi:hypothetical protein
MCTASQLQTFPSTAAGAGGYTYATQTVTLSAISIVNGCAQITSTCAAPAGDYAVIIVSQLVKTNTFSCFSSIAWKQDQTAASIAVTTQMALSL